MCEREKIYYYRRFKSTNKSMKDVSEDATASLIKCRRGYSTEKLGSEESEWNSNIWQQFGTRW